jgi:preprotein translocase subunit SecG
MVVFVCYDVVSLVLLQNSNSSDCRNHVNDDIKLGLARAGIYVME